MKKICTSLLLLLFVTIGAIAQTKTLYATRYKEFRPSIVTFADGHQSRQQLTNVFLKNGALLFLQGELTMEANMDNIVAVDFPGDRSFVAIDKQLAFLVDTVGTNALYCVELFDQESYERNIRNNINYTDISLGDQISTVTTDLNNEGDYQLPVFRHYYILYNGEYIRVHERELFRRLPKDKRTLMRRIMAMPNFSWQHEDSLLQLLKAISGATLNEK